MSKYRSTFIRCNSKCMYVLADVDQWNYRKKHGSSKYLRTSVKCLMGFTCSVISIKQNVKGALAQACSKQNKSIVATFNCTDLKQTVFRKYNKTPYYVNEIVLFSPCLTCLLVPNTCLWYMLSSIYNQNYAILMGFNYVFIINSCIGVI